jgi:hypothetical protein
MMLRALLHYFLIGGLLFSAKVVYETRSTDGPELTVRVPARASAAEVEKAVREAILINEARRYAWDRRDPVVFSHLVRNMRFIEPDTTDDDATLYKRALGMGMHEHDPIVRARLLYRAGEALAFVPEDRIPTREELEAHRVEHADRFQREGRVRFQQVFLSRSRRGDSLPADARELRAQLDELGDAAPTGLGDPLPGLRQELLATPSKLRTRFGPELADAVAEAVVGVWRGPASSVYGLHFIKVLDKEPARLPPLEAIGAEVRADLLRDVRAELRKERMAALRDAYTVHIERVP